MTKNYSTQRVTVPTVYVTKGRQRVKQYDNNTIFLKNGDEFELELFNPTSNKVLAKIDLNGKSLGSGIILRPGERVFLERYFDEAKKFLFETYEIDGGDYNALQAIKMNGIVEVKFYNEQRPPAITYYSAPITWTYGYYSNTGGVIGNAGPMGCSGTQVTANNNASNTIMYCGANNDESVLSSNTLSSLETGRVEKGSNSNQSFVYDSTTFNSWYTWNYTWKILPESQKPLVKEDLKVFCTNCGAKRKKASHQFCPTCGNRF